MEYLGFVLFDLKTLETDYINIFSAETLEEADEILEEYVDEMVRKPVMYEVIECDCMTVI